MTIQGVESLSSEFAVPGRIWFEMRGELIVLFIRTELAEASIYLQGAQLATWEPAHAKPVLYLSPRSNYLRGIDVRGGIPVLFPFFWKGWDETKSPAHGFARTSEWTLVSAAADDSGLAHIRLSLGPNEASRQISFPDFALTIDFAIGRELEVKLRVENSGAEEFTFEEGLHAYFQISDIRQITLAGLAGTVYIDKNEKAVRKAQTDELMRFTQRVDQVHLDTASPLSIRDDDWKRTIQIEKEGSLATVVWSPWSSQDPGLSDLPEDGWRDFVCVETVNASDNRVTLRPGQEHTMRMRVTVSAPSLVAMPGFFH